MKKQADDHKKLSLELKAKQLKDKQEVQMALNVCGYDSKYETRYHEIFLLDNWTHSEAVDYLVGIWTHQKNSNTKDYNDGGLITLDGNVYDELVEPRIMRGFRAQVKQLTKLLLSGDHLPKNPPAYYINWAESKGYKIPWLKYVVDEGLYIPPQLLGNKPLLEKERDTLSVIIAALAKEAGLDINKVSKTAEIIARTTQEMGAPVGATTIETHLKRIPQAIATRIK